MSADIIPFSPRTLRAPSVRETSQLLHFAARQPDDLTMDHADTAPCEYVPLYGAATGDAEPA